MRVRRQAAAAALALATVLAGTATAFASGPSPVSAKDPTGDYTLVDGPPGPRSASIDIESMRWARSGTVLRTTVIIRRLRRDVLNQYAVFRAVDPDTGRRFLIQASTVTPVAHVAIGSWANRVKCPDATGRATQRRDGTGRIVATVPLGCLHRPAELKRLRVQTVATSYSVDEFYSLDNARTKKVLRLR